MDSFVEGYKSNSPAPAREDRQVPPLATPEKMQNGAQRNAKVRATATPRPSTRPITIAHRADSVASPRPPAAEGIRRKQHFGEIKNEVFL